MPTMDQVAWANANVVVGESREPYARGALLPEPHSAEEIADRATLRMIGALRVVEVVYTAEELADQARAQGTANAARESAGQVDPSVPLGDQTEVRGEPGPPTMMGVGGAPVVIGDENLKAEHDKQARQAEKRGREAEADKGDKAKAEEAKPGPAQHQAQQRRPGTR